MHRIDSSGSVNGRFDEGNPAAGQLATRVTAAWLNDTQENILAVLDDAGVVPEKGRAADLLDAIKAVAIGILGTGGGGGGPSGVPTDRRIDGGGLVTGGGDLSVNRTLTVTAATPEEIRAGVANDKVVTPAGLAASVRKLLAPNGFYEHLGGKIDAWGSVRGNYSEGPVFIAFAAPFPSACTSVVWVPANNAGAGNRDTMPQIVSRTAEGFTAMFQWSGGGGTTSAIDGLDYQAVGY